MPDFHHNKKFNKHDQRHDHRHEHKQEPREVEDEEDVKWNPTPEVFEAFTKRDAELCAGNLRMVLSSRSGLSLKELKDSTLHSSDVVERQVSAWVQEGFVQESKGKYSLAPVQR